MKENNEEPLAINVEEARRRLGISRGLIYQAIHSGKIPAVRIGKRLLIPVSALKKFLDAAVQEQL